MARDAYEPTVAVRCTECGKAHYDEQFAVCRGCGVQLP